MARKKQLLKTLKLYYEKSVFIMPSMHTSCSDVENNIRIIQIRKNCDLFLSHLHPQFLHYFTYMTYIQLYTAYLHL